MAQWLGDGLSPGGPFNSCRDLYIHTSLMNGWLQEMHPVKTDPMFPKKPQLAGIRT